MRKPLKLKGLIIAEYYPPDITAGAFRMEDMSIAMQGAGIEVTVLTSVPHRVVLEKVRASHADPTGIQVVRIPVPPAGKSAVSRILNYGRFSLSAFNTALFRLPKDYNIVVVSSPPLLLAVTGYLVSRINKARLIADVRDIWPDSAVAAGMLSEKSFLYKSSLWLERFFYRSADRITCVAKPMKEYISKFVAPEKVKVLYNGVSTSVVRRIDEESVIALPRNSSKIHLVYAGNIGRLQGVDIIIRALLRLRDSGETDFELTIVGEGIELPNLKKLVETSTFDGIYFTGAVPREEVSKYCANADVLFLNLLDHPSLEKTVPSKLFDYLLYCKPVLAGIRGEGEEIIEMLETGVTFKPNNLDDLLRALAILKKKISDLKIKAVKNREYVLEHFYRPKIFREFFDGVGKEMR